VVGAATVRPIFACVLATTEHVNATVANEVVCGLGLFKHKIGSVGAATTTLALFALRLKSVLLLAHKLAQSLRFALFWASKIKVRSSR
jgi:hypothetical protein